MKHLRQIVPASLAGALLLAASFSAQAQGYPGYQSNRGAIMTPNGALYYNVMPGGIISLQDSETGETTYGRVIPYDSYSPSSNPGAPQEGYGPLDDRMQQHDQ